MNIRLMEEQDFPEVASIDCAAFGKDVARPGENLALLRDSLPGCALVAVADGKTVGYTFSKQQGDEGYIGPVGLSPEHQGKGYGTALLKESINYLKRTCKVIGLEVRPLKVNNISIYSGLGFQTAFPTFIYEVKDFDYAPPGELRILELAAADGASRKVIDSLEDWLGPEFGLSYRADLDAILRLKGKALVAVAADRPIGFLAHGGFLSPHLWGAVSNRAEQSEIFKALLKTANAAFPGPLLLGVNTRYRNVVKVFSELRLPISFVMNRMLLEGFGGRFFEQDDGISVRSWMG